MMSNKGVLTEKGSSSLNKQDSNKRPIIEVRKKPGKGADAIGVYEVRYGGKTISWHDGKRRAENAAKGYRNTRENKPKNWREFKKYFK